MTLQSVPRWQANLHVNPAVFSAAAGHDFATKPLTITSTADAHAATAIAATHAVIAIAESRDSQNAIASRTQLKEQGNQNGRMIG
jgi:hypothetical protein